MEELVLLFKLRSVIDRFDDCFSIFQYQQMSLEHPSPLLVFSAGKKYFYSYCLHFYYVLSPFLSCIRDALENCSWLSVLLRQ